MGVISTLWNVKIDSAQWAFLASPRQHVFLREESETITCKVEYLVGHSQVAVSNILEDILTV